jgi:hypothetical protein
VADRINRENIGWGLVFVVVGAALTTERLGWWEFGWIDLSLLGPLALIAIGLVVAATALVARRT